MITITLPIWLWLIIVGLVVVAGLGTRWVTHLDLSPVNRFDDTAESEKEDSRC